MERQVLFLTTFVVLVSSTWSLKTVKTGRRHGRTCECSFVLPYSPSEYVKPAAESKTCSVRSAELAELRREVGLLQKVQIGERMRCNSFAGQLDNVTSLMFQLEDHAYQQEKYGAHAETRLRAFSQETLQFQRLLAGHGNFMKFLEARVGVLRGDMTRVADLSRRVETLAQEETEKREATILSMDELEKRIRLAEESTQAFLWLMTEALSKIPHAERKIMHGLKKAKTPIASSVPERLSPRKHGPVNWVPPKHVQVEEDYILDVTPR